MGDNEQRWYMWYSGSSAPMEGLAGVAAAAGSIGEGQGLVPVLLGPPSFTAPLQHGKTELQQQPS